MASCNPAVNPTEGVTIISKRGNQPGQVSRPRAVAITDDQHLIVLDRTGRIQLFDLDDAGKFLSKKVLPEFSNGTPTGMAIDRRDDSIWIADTHYQRILHYRKDLVLLSQFGEVGTEPGKMVFPTDVCPDPIEDVVWVTEYGERNRLMKFSTDGKFLQEWGGDAYQAGELLRPMAVEVDKLGRIFVADAGQHRVNVYGRDGGLLYRIGSAGTGPGELKYPYDISLAPDGTLYVCEYGNDRISHFTVEGQYLGAWGGPGRGPGEFFSAWGMCTGPKGDIVVADTNNNRLQHLSDPSKVFLLVKGPSS